MDAFPQEQLHAVSEGGFASTRISESTSGPATARDRTGGMRRCSTGSSIVGRDEFAKIDVWDEDWGAVAASLGKPVPPDRVADPRRAIRALHPRVAKTDSAQRRRFEHSLVSTGADSVRLVSSHARWRSTDALEPLRRATSSASDERTVASRRRHRRAARLSVTVRFLTTMICANLVGSCTKPSVTIALLHDLPVVARLCAEWPTGQVDGHFPSWGTHTGKQHSSLSYRT